MKQPKPPSGNHRNWKLSHRAHSLVLLILIGSIFALAILVVGFAAALIDGKTFPVESWVFLLLLAFLVALLGYAWHQTFFDISDLRRLLKTRAGSVNLASLHQIRGLDGELEIFIRPWTDPKNPVPRSSAGNAVLTSARVEVRRSGDFRSLPSRELQLDETTRFQETANSTGDPELDEALDTAARELVGTDFDLKMKIEPSRLRVFVTGGAWMNREFALRIEKALDFTEKLLDILHNRYRGSKPAQPDSRWHIRPEVHSFLLPLILILAAINGLFVLLLWTTWLAGEVIGPGAWWLLAGFALCLSILLPIWRRALFQHADLRKLLRKRGGDLDSVGYSEIHGHVGELKISTEPWQDPEEKPLPWSAGGISPALRSARLEASHSGDFRDLPSLEMEIYRDFRFTEPWQSTGHPDLDRALDDAVAELASLDCTLDLRIEANKIRVFVTGAAWTNRVFAHRIEKTLDFTERVLEHLS